MRRKREKGRKGWQEEKQMGFRGSSGTFDQPAVAWKAGGEWRREISIANKRDILSDIRCRKGNPVCMLMCRVVYVWISFPGPYQYDCVCIFVRILHVFSKNIWDCRSDSEMISDYFSEHRGIRKYKLIIKLDSVRLYRGIQFQSNFIAKWVCFHVQVFAEIFDITLLLCPAVIQPADSPNKFSCHVAVCWSFSGSTTSGTCACKCQTVNHS